MDKNVILIMLISIVFVSGCANFPLFGCTKEAKICPGGGGVGRNPWRLCAFDPCPKTYACQQDSDCVIGIYTGACCGCESAYHKQQVEDEKDVVVYLSDEHRALPRKTECKNIMCEPCQTPGVAQCVDNQCRMIQKGGELCGNMTFAEAMQIAKDSDCVKDGGLKSDHFCNEITGTWWIDLDIQKQGCNPACVINVDTKQAEINWRCTGLIIPS